jgi:type II secretory pathway pseudopilin PulG
VDGQKLKKQFRRDNIEGYTLLEVVIALAILTAVVVPLVSIISRTVFTGNLKNELTGIWLCEQEADLIMAFPDHTIPVKHRYIDNLEWTIKTEKSGSGLIRYTLTAYLHDRSYASLNFYGRNPGADK